MQNFKFKNLNTTVPKGDNFLIVAEYPELRYALLYRNQDFEPWIVAYGFNREQRCWANGNYFQTLDKAMEYIQAKKQVCGYNRLDEIASKSIDKLIELDPYEAEEFLKDELELDDDEVYYFGIVETLDMAKGYEEE